MSQLLAFQQQWCLTHWGDPGVNVWGPPTQPRVGNKNPQGYQLLAPPVCQVPGKLAP